MPRDGSTLRLPALDRPEDAVWIFDLDNTLYPASCNLFHQVDQRMTAFIADFLGLPREEARAKQKHYYRTYGTTLRGLMTEHAMPADRFLDYVHEIDLTPVDPSPALDAALGRLAGRKLVYTNGSLRHAENVLNRLASAIISSTCSTSRRPATSPSRTPRPTPASSSAMRSRRRAPASSRICRATWSRRRRSA